MKIIKKKAKDFSINFIYLNSFTTSKYQNFDADAMHWVYMVYGDLQINYMLNGFEGSYYMISDVLADLRPIKNLETIWKSSDSFCKCISFIPNDPQDSYEAEVLSFTEKEREFNFDKEIISVALSGNIHVNNKEIAENSIFRNPPNRTIKLKSTDKNGSLLIFYKNEQ